MSTGNMVKGSVRSLIFKVIMMAALMKSIVFLTGCDKAEAVDEPITVKTNTCKETAVFRNNLCGYGVWGGFVIETESKAIFQPWESLVDVRDIKPYEGMKIRITYSSMAYDNRYDDRVTCQAVGPYRPQGAIRIECIEVVQ